MESHKTIEIYECGDGVVLAPDGDLTAAFYTDESHHPGTNDLPWKGRVSKDCQDVLAGNGSDWHPGPADYSDSVGDSPAAIFCAGLNRPGNPRDSFT